MKNLELKFNSDQKFTCRMFEIFVKEKEENKIVMQPTGKAIVIQETNEVILLLSQKIKLTEEEESILKNKISKMYGTAREIGFVVDIVSKDIQISME